MVWGFLSTHVAKLQSCTSRVQHISCLSGCNIRVSALNFQRVGCDIEYGRLVDVDHCLVVIHPRHFKYMDLFDTRSLQCTGIIYGTWDISMGKELYSKLDMEKQHFKGYFKLCSVCLNVYSFVELKCELR